LSSVTIRFEWRQAVTAPASVAPWQLNEVACQAVGSMPMRDVLAALPQTCVWLRSWDQRGVRPTGFDEARVREEMKSIAEVVLFVSLLFICVPNAAQVLCAGKNESLEFSSDIRVLTKGSTGPMKNSTESAIQHRFGAIVADTIAGRMDLIRYGRARDVVARLDGVKLESADSRELWEALWQLVRT
jgi:hypothetical protein